MIRFKLRRNEDRKTLHVLDKVLRVACMAMHEFIQLWRIEYYAKNLHLCWITVTMTFQIYKTWSLLDSNSTKFELEPASLKIRRTGGDAS